MLAAELVLELRAKFAKAAGNLTTDYQPLEAGLEPRFFGAGGPRMAAAGVELALDMTAHSVTGVWEVVKKYPRFRKIFYRLYDLALQREPAAVICVDFGGFNLRFAGALRAFVRKRADWFHDWSPKVIQYVSPQVWASREGRAYRIARDYDLLLSIFPFEKAWYAKRVPGFRVEFVGHPIMDRHEMKAESRGPKDEWGDEKAELGGQTVAPQKDGGQRGARAAEVLLLPGSRRSELARHLPVLIRGLALMRASLPELKARMVLPSQALIQQAKAFGLPGHLEMQLGNLPQALRSADVGIASTGTVTVECAYFGVPTVALYKTAWATYEIGRRLATVKHLAMPNILAGEEIFPEFIQQAASPENISRAALELLRDEGRRARIKTRLAELVGTLGEPGAAKRAARVVAEMLGG